LLTAPPLDTAAMAADAAEVAVTSLPRLPQRLVADDGSDTAVDPRRGGRPHDAAAAAAAATMAGTRLRVRGIYGVTGVVAAVAGALLLLLATTAPPAAALQLRGTAVLAAHGAFINTARCVMR